MRQEAVHEGAAGAGDIGAADTGFGQGAANSVDGVVVQLVKFLWRAGPVGRAVGFVPHLEIPAGDLGAAVAFDIMARPLIDEFGPLLIRHGRGVPAAADQFVGKARPPAVLVGDVLCGRRQGLRHEADLQIRFDATRPVGVDNAVGDGPVVDGFPLCIFGIGIGAAPFEGRRAVARIQEIMGAEIDLFGPQTSQMTHQFAAVLHRGVVGLVGAEEAPDWLQLALRPGGIDRDVHGDRWRIGQRPVLRQCGHGDDG